MRDRDWELALLMTHDDDDALGKRGDVVAAGAAVEVAHPALFHGQRRVDVAEAIDFERAEKSGVDDAAMQIHSHDVEKAAPAGGAIENARIGKANRRMQRAHIGDADFEQWSEPRCMRALGEKTRNLRQADTDDDDFAILELAGAGRNHDFGGANLRHLSNPAPDRP